MSEDYEALNLLNEGLARLTHPKHGVDLWTSRKLRKPSTCVVCEGSMRKGLTAFGPITNGYNRMHRICVNCIIRLVEMTEAKAKKKR